METVAQYRVSTQPATLINPATLVEYTAPGYQQPTSDDVRNAIKCLAHPDGAIYTGSDVAGLTGVDGRTVRKWLAPENTGSARGIPYSAWRLILLAAGLAEPPRAKRSEATGPAFAYKTQASA